MCATRADTSSRAECGASNPGGYDGFRTPGGGGTSLEAECRQSSCCSPGTTFVEVILERLVDLCIRGERNVFRQGVLENLLRGLVLSIGVFSLRGALQRRVPRRDWR